MEYRHIIFLYSDFSSGKRIGLHFLYDEKNMESIDTMNEVMSKNDNISVYSVTNNTTKIRHLAKTDPFYKSVKFFDGSSNKEIGEFLNSIRENSKIKIRELLFLILTRKRCSFLQLSIYFYFCFCLYTIEYRKMPTNEKVRCEKYGIDLNDFHKISENINFQQDVNLDFLDREKIIKQLELPPFAEINSANRRKVNAVFSNSTVEYKTMVGFAKIIDKVTDISLIKLYENMVDSDSVYFKASHSDSNHLTMDKISKNKEQIKKIFTN